MYGEEVIGKVLFSVRALVAGGGAALWVCVASFAASWVNEGAGDVFCMGKGGVLHVLREFSLGLSRLRKGEGEKKKKKKN
jgi:Flp pilus assembly protein protease CpaA